jgi:hypothetical protein
MSGNKSANLVLKTSRVSEEGNVTRLESDYATR